MPPTSRAITSRIWRHTTLLYWKNVKADNPDDEQVIGTVRGLRECKAMAQGHSTGIGEDWNERSYICALVDDGGYAEKHRLLN